MPAMILSTACPTEIVARQILHDYAELRVEDHRVSGGPEQRLIPARSITPDDTMNSPVGSAAFAWIIRI